MAKNDLIQYLNRFLQSETCVLRKNVHFFGIEKLHNCAKSHFKKGPYYQKRKPNEIFEVIILLKFNLRKYRTKSHQLVSSNKPPWPRLQARILGYFVLFQSNNFFCLRIYNLVLSYIFSTVCRWFGISIFVVEHAF